MTDLSEKELQELMDQRIEEKKEELKKEAKQEVRKEIRQEIVENVRKETDNENMSRRQFLKKAGLGAAGLGALGLAPAASQLKLTKNGIFPGSGSTSIKGDLDMEGKDLTNANQVKSTSISTDTANIGGTKRETVISGISGGDTEVFVLHPTSGDYNTDIVYVRLLFTQTTQPPQGYWEGLATDSNQRDFNTQVMNDGTGSNANVSLQENGSGEIELKVENTDLYFNLVADVLIYNHD